MNINAVHMTGALPQLLQPAMLACHVTQANAQRRLPVVHRLSSCNQAQARLPLNRRPSFAVQPVPRHPEQQGRPSVALIEQAVQLALQLADLQGVDAASGRVRAGRQPDIEAADIRLSAARRVPIGSCGHGGSRAGAAGNVGALSGAHTSSSVPPMMTTALWRLTGRAASSRSGVVAAPSARATGRGGGTTG